jgi:hypothetical protein
MALLQVLTLVVAVFVAIGRSSAGAAASDAGGWISA